MTPYCFAVGCSKISVKKSEEADLSKPGRSFFIIIIRVLGAALDSRWYFEITLYLLYLTIFFINLFTVCY
jgi:hypothetical protein